MFWYCGKGSSAHGDPAVLAGATERMVSECRVYSLCQSSGPVHTVTPNNTGKKSDWNTWSCWIKCRRGATADFKLSYQELKLGHIFPAQFSEERASQQQGAALSWGPNTYKKPQEVLSNQKGDMRSGERATLHICQLQTFLLLSNPTWPLGR